MKLKATVVTLTQRMAKGTNQPIFKEIKIIADGPHLLGDITRSNDPAMANGSVWTVHDFVEEVSVGDRILIEITKAIGTD